VVYALHLKTAAGEVPQVPAFVDSPLAINATDVYRVHTESLQDDLQKHLFAHEDPFGFGKLLYTRTVEESKAINLVQGPAIIISANGMAEAGRVLHHLKHNIEDERNTILFVGYQAENTLGRRLVDGAKQVKIFGDEYRVRAQIRLVDGFSAHADRSELVAWVADVKENLKGIFVVHGEEQAALSFAEALRAIGGFTVTVPEPNQTIEV
jgi:metallo-beta-lactamase family protein